MMIPESMSGDCLHLEQQQQRSFAHRPPSHSHNNPPPLYNRPPHIGGALPSSITAPSSSYGQPPARPPFHLPPIADCGQGSGGAQLQSRERLSVIYVIDAGCTVQLRGKGCSQPSSQWPDEPVHLFVKYDSDTQFDRFKEILKDIVDGYEAQNPKRPRPTVPKPQPVESVPTAPSASPSSLPVNIPGWNLSNFTESMLSAETDLLWLFRVFLIKEHSVYLDDLPSRVASFFCMDSIEPQLSATSIPPGPNQLRDFVRSCPHCLILILMLDPGTTLGADGDIPAWSRPAVSLCEAMASIQKDNLKELHRSVRKEQATSSLRNGTDTIGNVLFTPQQPLSFLEYNALLSTTHHPGPPSDGLPLGQYPPSSILPTTRFSSSQLNSDGRQPGALNHTVAATVGSAMGYPPPISALCLLLQALHFLIQETQETTFIGLEERFMSRFDLPLKVSVFGYNSVVAFVKAYPTVFRDTGSGREMRVSSLPNPDFSIDNTMVPSGTAGLGRVASSGSVGTTLAPVITHSASARSSSGLSAVAAAARAAQAAAPLRTMSQSFFGGSATGDTHHVHSHGMAELPPSQSSMSSFPDTTLTGTLPSLDNKGQTILSSFSASNNSGAPWLSGSSSHTGTSTPASASMAKTPTTTKQPTLHSVEQNAPRLLGLLGKLVSSTQKPSASS